MTRSVARTPINPAYKVRPYIPPNENKRKIDAKWGTEQSSPNSPVSIVATIRERIESKFAKVEIYYVLDGQNYDVCTLQVPIVGNNVNYQWTADPVKKGNFEQGFYHFYISAGLYWGATQKPLLLRDITQRNVDMFVQSPVHNPNMPKI
jgi:hypothetical protein